MKPWPPRVSGEDWAMSVNGRLSIDVRDPQTLRTKNSRMIGRLWHVQGGICAICGKAMQPTASQRGSNRLSIDHVWPKDDSRTKGLPSPPGAGRLPCRARTRTNRRRWNKVVAHGRCNSAKGNRPPNGCELIWLMAVRARMEAA